MINIIEKDFSLDDYYSKIKSDYNGAISFFLGTVREDLYNDIDKIESIYLETYEDLAFKQLEIIKAEAIKNWNLNDCIIIHRVGNIKVGEKIVLVITSSSHREEAIKSNEYIIDQLKVRAAFWKFKQLNKDLEIIKQKDKDIRKVIEWGDISK